MNPERTLTAGILLAVLANVLIAFFVGCVAGGAAPAIALGAGEAAASQPAVIEAKANQQTGQVNAIADVQADLTAALVRADCLEADLQAALVKVDSLDAELSAVKFQIGQMTTTIGGGSDTVTAWIYALFGAGSWPIYLVFVRPTRQWYERRGKRNGGGSGDTRKVAGA